MTAKRSNWSAAQMERALARADMRVLLMVLFHLTGDETWLQPPFLPARDVRLIAEESAGLSEQARQQICAAVLARLSEPEKTPAISDPGNELMVRMMQVCLAETIPPEYAPMMREQLGFVARNDDIPHVNVAKVPEQVRQRPVLIVGAGASGLAVGASLLELGIPFVIVEKAGDVGGTWRENTYPGCAVDTPNHAYSYSFAKPYSWSRYFSPRDELQDYLRRSASEFGLTKHIRFNTSVEAARWVEQEGCWIVSLQTHDSEEEIKATALVSAIGQLSLPAKPEFDGSDQFAGDLFHSAQWPEGMDITNKHVAVVGTGATSMQLVPAIADQAASVTVYQRSPQWTRPVERFHDLIDAEAQWLLEHLPFYAAWYRLTMLWRYGDGLLPSLRIDPQWPYPERSLNRSNDRHRLQMTKHINTVLAGRDELIRQCLPDYPPYGKRILLDNHWYETLLKPTVELVTKGISHFDTDGIVDADGRHRDADIVVLATGFQVGLMAARLNITGADGLNLSDAWANSDPTAYIGITVPGFPNFFCTQGPTTGLGHGGSAIFTGECQAHYIASCLATMLSHEKLVLEVKRQAHDDYMQRFDAEHQQMIWNHPGMTTYYRNARGRVFSVMPWRLVDFWHMTRQPVVDHYDWRDASESERHPG
ncbi:MAG: NAD(P)/FAD-dependent oxidoreductase [Burkholderiaceae bacterium]